MRRPTWLEPVNDTMAMSGSVQIASPASAPPGSTCSTPFGSSASSKMRAMMNPPVSAVRGSGLSTTALPVASAGATARHRQDEREVERRNHADDAARQAPGDADAARIGRQHQALRLGAHGGGAIEDFRHHMDFESGFGRDAAGLPRDPGDQLFLIVFQNPGGLAQDGAAFLVGRRGPAGLRGARLGGGSAHVGRGGVADAGQRGAGRRLQDIQRSAGGGAPFRAEYASAPGPLDKKFCYRCVHPVFPLYFLSI